MVTLGEVDRCADASLNSIRALVTSTEPQALLELGGQPHVARLRWLANIHGADGDGLPGDNDLNRMLALFHRGGKASTEL